MFKVFILFIINPNHLLNQSLNLVFHALNCNGVFEAIATSLRNVNSEPFSRAITLFHVSEAWCVFAPRLIPYKYFLYLFLSHSMEGVFRRQFWPLKRWNCTFCFVLKQAFAMLLSVILPVVASSKTDSDDEHVAQRTTWQPLSNRQTNPTNTHRWSWCLNRVAGWKRSLRIKDLGFFQYGLDSTNCCNAAKFKRSAQQVQKAVVCIVM